MSKFAKARIYKSEMPFYFGYTVFLASILFSNVGFVAENHDLLSAISTIAIFFGVITNLDRLSAAFSSYKKAVAFLTIFVLALVSFFVSKNFIIIRLLVVLLGAMCIDLKSIMKFDFIVRSFLMLTIVLMAVAGLIPNIAIERTEGFTRYALGFSHPNVLGVNLMMVILELNYLIRKKTAQVIAIDLAAIIFEYIIPNCRVAMVIIFLAMLHILFRDKINKLLTTKLMSLIVKWSFMIFAGIILILTFAVRIENNAVITVINKISSNRLVLYDKAVKGTDIGLFGAAPENNGTKTVTMDNAYLELILTLGILQFMCFGWMSYFCFKKLYDIKAYYLIVIMLIMGVYGMVETPYINISTNMFLLLFVLPFKKLPKSEERRLVDATK